MVIGFTRKDFLEALFGDYFRTRDGFIMVKCFRNLDKDFSFRYFPNVEVLARQQYRESENVFFGVCPRETMKPDSQYVHYASALWAGLDFGSEGYSGRTVYLGTHSQAAKAVRSFPFPPSIIVESGWGMHLYWLLNDTLEITDVERFERQLAKINSYFQCTSDVKIDTLLRLPGTLNCKKPSRAVNCNVKFINTEFRYDLAEFERLSLGEDEAPASTGPAMPSRTGADDTGEIDAKEVEDFLARDAERAARARKVAANPEPLPPLVSPLPSKSSGGATSSPFEPVVYESQEPDFTATDGGPNTETVSVMVETMTVAGENLVEEKIAQRVAEILSEQFLDDLADKVVQKLIKKTKRGSGA